MADQVEWRYCQNCHQLFYNGFPNKGQCGSAVRDALSRTRGGHSMQPGSYNFDLPSDFPPTKTLQSGWRYCGRCHALFYAGFPKKGVCAAGGEHQANGPQFGLPHALDQKMLSLTYTQQHTQKAWRFCGRCYVLFYDGYAKKGQCAAGGEHKAYGWTYMLPHDLPGTLEFHLPIVLHNNVPIVGINAPGKANLVLKRDGSYRWWGNLRGATAGGYNINHVAVLVVDSQNNPYEFRITPGHLSGAMESGSGEYQWGDPMEEKQNGRIKDNWIFLAAGATADCGGTADLDAVNLILLIATGMGVAALL